MQSYPVFSWHKHDPAQPTLFNVCLASFPLFSVSGEDRRGRTSTFTNIASECLGVMRSIELRWFFIFSIHEDSMHKPVYTTHQQGGKKTLKKWNWS